MGAFFIHWVSDTIFAIFFSETACWPPGEPLRTTVWETVWYCMWMLSTGCHYQEVEVAVFSMCIFDWGPCRQQMWRKQWQIWFFRRYFSTLFMARPVHGWHIWTFYKMVEGLLSQNGFVILGTSDYASRSESWTAPFTVWHASRNKLYEIIS
jgi:hypothetical protein